MGRARVAKTAVVTLAVASLSHCVGATEIMVDLHTDVACDVVGVRGVTIAVGAPDDDTTGIATTSTYCDAGELGTLALTPRGDIGGPVALRAVLGVNSRAEDCTPQNDFGGCIVARRSLRYSPHTKLTLPIDLDQDCLDDPCGADSTCVHGSCTDAGVTCDGGLCGLDAGPPSCTDTKTTLLSSTSAAATPRIARTSKGYAIAWMPTPNTIWAQIVAASGATISGAVPIATLGTTAKIDAIAMDAAEKNYLVVYEEAGVLTGATVSTQGAAIGAPATYASTTGPKGGAFWDSGQSVWATAGIKSTIPYFLTIAPTAKVAGTLTSTGATGVSLSRYQSTYYATTDEGTQCGLHTCTLTAPSAATCSRLSVPSCSAMRAAAVDSTTAALSIVSGGTLTFLLSTGGPLVPDGPIDDPEAMVPLVVGSTPYRIVWRTSLAIVTDTFPTKGVVDTLDSSGFNAPGAGFDAVADDPSQTGYAVVYYRTGNPASIQLSHRCK